MTRKLEVPKPLPKEYQSAADTIAILAGYRQCPLCGGRGGYFVRERDVEGVGVYHTLVSCAACDAAGWWTPTNPDADSQYAIAEARSRARSRQAK